MNPFRLQRKAERYKGKQRELTRIIKSVEPSRTTETQCIRVSNPDHLYITDDYVVTHNSSYALRVCSNAYFVQGKTPMFFSLEMEDHKLTQRWVAAAAKISYRAMKRPAEAKLDDDALRKWEEIARRAREASIDKDILMLSHERRPTEDYVYSMVETYKPDFIVVDTIDKIAAPAHCKSSYDRGYHAASALKAIARTTRVPVIAIAQANRESVEGGVSLHTIADSIAIAREGDIAVGMQATPEQKSAHMCEFSLLKNRDDGGEGTRQAMYFNPGTMELRPWRAQDSTGTK
jgi:replicative DNA helicase